MLKESEEELEEINEEIEPKQKMTSKDTDKSLDAILSYYEDNQALDDSILDALKIRKIFNLFHVFRKLPEKETFSYASRFIETSDEIEELNETVKKEREVP